MKHVLFLCALSMAAFMLSACSSISTDYQSYLSKKGVSQPHPEHFQHCQSYGCQTIKDVQLSTQDWQDIASIFKKPPASPAQERAGLAKAIGVFETRVGAITGSEEDIHGTFIKLGHNQLDCVDESTNTTIYLDLLQQKGFLHFHDIEAPNTRIPLIHYMGRWPHQTAVIVEKQTGARFAVDSWFHDNGVPAEIVPLQDWKDGWKPAAKRDSLSEE